MTPLGLSTILLSLLWGINIVSSSPAPASGELTFTALSKPLPLYPGEVTNTWHHIEIPNGPIAISEFSADIVEKDGDGELVAVPLSEAYLHHHVVYSSDKRYKTTEKKGVGFGAGTESRGSRQIFPYPYRFTTLPDEDEFVANIHVINTRSLTPDQAYHCAECPCTQEDYVKEGERKKDGDLCNAQLQDESNPSCYPEMYAGGLHCCHHGEFCLDEYYIPETNIPLANKTTKERTPNPELNATQSVFYLRYTLSYQPLTEQDTAQIHPLYLAACCDATGDLTSNGNIEYDIQPCTNTDGEDECVHTLTTTQQLDGSSSAGPFAPNANEDKEKWVDVVYMVGHLHRSGISMDLYYAENDTLVCQSLPRYGNGSVNEIDNEPHYINAMNSCTFDPPLRMKTTTPLKIVGKYNSTLHHTGVMSLFYIALADVLHVPNEEGEKEGVGFFGRFHGVAIVLALVILLLASLKIILVRRASPQQQGYEPV